MGLFIDSGRVAPPNIHKHPRIIRFSTQTIHFGGASRDAPKAHQLHGVLNSAKKKMCSIMILVMFRSSLCIPCISLSPFVSICLPLCPLRQKILTMILFSTPLLVSHSGASFPASFVGCLPLKGRSCYSLTSKLSHLSYLSQGVRR